MPFKIHDGEIIIECQTVEEAAQLAHYLKSSKTETVTNKLPSGSSNSSDGSRWTANRLKHFMELLQGKEAQQKILKTLLDSPEGKTDRQLLHLLNWSSGKMLGGSVAGLTKNAKKAGVGGEELLLKNEVIIDGESLTEYKLTDSFRSAFKNSGRN